MADNKVPKLEITKTPAPAPASAPASASADPRRVSVIVPPDRHQQLMYENTRRVSSVQAPNQPLQLNIDRRRTSVVQQPAASQVSLPEKFRKHSVARAPLLAQLQQMQTTPGGQLLPSGSHGNPKRASAPEALLRKESDGSLTPSGNNSRKLSKAQVAEYYSHIRTISKFHKSQSFGSMKSYNSTISSVSSEISVSSEVSPSVTGSDNSGPDWAQRWVIDKAGKLPGQIKCAKDACFLRSTGNIAVAEYKNARIQIFSSSGKSLAVLGPDSDNDRTASSFNNPLNFRKIEPTGICETNICNLLVVTDHSRLLYIDASASGLLEAEIMVNNRNSLHGVAATQNNKLILCETGTQASVGLFETNGRLVREYKGDFKQPAYVAWNEDFEIAAVSDSEEHVVYLYDANGHLLNKLGKQLGSQRGAEEVGPLIYPSGVTWFSEGRLLVADRAENRVVLFDLRNQKAENLLTEQDGLGHPVALATNGKNRIVLTEEFYDFGVDKYQLKMFKHKSSSTFNNEF